MLNLRRGATDTGSKWSLTALYKHLAAEGVDVEALKARYCCC